MSYQLMAWATSQHTGSPTRKAVLIALANRTNHDTGLCCPSVETIAAETEFGRTAVKNALADLCDMGLLSRDRKRRQDGSMSTYVYRFPPAAAGPSDGQPGTPGDPSPGTGGDPRNQELPSNQDFPPTPPPGGDAAAGHRDNITAVYEHWRHARGKTDPRYRSISGGRHRKISARLADGFTVQQLTDAIDAIKLDPWPDRDRHDDLTVIFRSRETVDRWLDVAADTPAGRAALTWTPTAVAEWFENVGRHLPWTSLQAELDERQAKGMPRDVALEITDLWRQRAARDPSMRGDAPS